MTRATIDSLKQALALSPENLPLRMLLVRALFDAGATAEAADHLRKVATGPLAPADRALAGRMHLAVDDAVAASGHRVRGYRRSGNIFTTRSLPKAFSNAKIA